MRTRCVEQGPWMNARIRQDQVEKYLGPRGDFIPDDEIEKKLEERRAPSPAAVREILEKSRAIQTLTPDETAALLNVRDQALWRQMFQAAAEIKTKVYDNRIVTFAPLYLSNLCVNDCQYCGFRRSNQDAQRQILSPDEVRRETEVLAGQIGHKRLIVVYGEHPKSGIDYMVETLKAIYGVKVKTRNGWGSIRRVNVNAAPLAIEELRQLHEAGIGTYQVFQETYHHQTYAQMHPEGTIKADYRWRLTAMHRAFEAGVDDFGIGVLFGLYDWRFEVMGLLYHARELEQRFGVGPHTVSFPRLEPAHNTPYTESPRYQVSDEDFKKLITVIRLAIPYTGMILTARESAKLRRAVLPLGITQTDASSRIGVGAYQAEDRAQQQGRKQQFILGDTRSLDEVIRELAQMGYITSFCTAGYRCGRTGDRIMKLLRSGEEGRFCKLNAVLTFREWLDDFAGEETKKIAEPLIEKEIREIEKKNPKLYPFFMEYYQRIKRGERDLFI